MLGWYTNKKTIAVNIPNEDRSRFSFVKWKFLLEAPFEVSNKKDDQVVSLCEQGDMGLFGDPLSESDQEKLKKQQLKRAKRIANSSNPWESSYAALKIMTSAQ